MVSLFCVVFSVVNCTVLSVGRHVKTSPDSCLTSQMQFNTSCSFSCPQGYHLEGPSYKHCGANGQWTDSAKSVSCKGELKTQVVPKNTATTVLAVFTFFWKHNSGLRITAYNSGNGIFRYQRVHGVKWRLQSQLC